MKNMLWVVEMWIDNRSRWEPTVGVALTQESGRAEVHHWRHDNPSDKFRLVAYRRVKGAKC